MVYFSNFNSLDPLASFDDLFKYFVYRSPSDHKPPMAQFPTVLQCKDGSSEITGWEIQLAVAGYTEEDISVEVDSERLIIKGDNSKDRTVAENFRSSFKKELILNKELNLEEANVSLDKGILSIKVPLLKPQKKKFQLFGK